MLLILIGFNFLISFYVYLYLYVFFLPPFHYKCIKAFRVHIVCVLLLFAIFFASFQTIFMHSVVFLFEYLNKVSILTTTREIIILKTKRND